MRAPNYTVEVPSPATMAVRRAVGDAASLHPVFFTKHLRRAPPSAPVPVAANAMTPVAHGYVYHTASIGPGRAVGARL